jgi:hypothetical protein
MVLSFSEATAQAVQGAACSLLALNDEATRWINEAYGLDADFANIAGALRKNFCNESNPTGDYGPDVPFTGGQCPGVRYRVQVQGSWERERCANGDRANRSIDLEVAGCSGTPRIFGPITPTPIALEGDCGVYRRGQELNGFDADGSPVTIEAAWGNDGPTSTLVNESVSIIVTRCDGQPDDCGDPQGSVDEFNDYSETVSITYEDNSQTTITEDIDITLGPLIIGIGGILYAPVTVGTGDITLNGYLELAPNISVDLFPDGTSGGGGDTDDPAPDPDVPDPTPVVTEQRRRIIGAIVTVTAYDEDVARVTQVAQGSTPDIFVPRTGNVSFYIDTPGGQAWTEPTPLRNVRQYVPCPAREGAVDVAVTEGTGFALDVTPVYADLSVS